MNLKKIIIYHHDVLFNILYEIKEKLNFNLEKVDKENFEELKKYLSTDYLIISSLEISELKNYLRIEEKPIKLKKLIELINLKFLKKIFNSQSDILIGSYKINLNSREISKNNITLDLTEREINLILFLKKSNSAVNIEELQKEVWDYGSELETHTVETHISKDLFTSKYKPRLVKPKKGKGSFKRLKKIKA